MEMVDSLITKEDDYRRMLTTMVQQVRKQKHDRSLSRDTSQSNYSLILRERFPAQENMLTNTTKGRSAANTKERIKQIQEEAMNSLFVAHDYQSGVTRLLTSEKLIKQLLDSNTKKEDAETLLLRLFNSFLLCSAYFNSGDHQRITRMSDSSAPNSLSALLDSFTKKNKVRKEIGNYVLHLFFIQARSAAIRNNHSRAQTLFYLVMRLFDKWRQCIYITQEETHHRNEFTDDDYIMAKASYAEQLMHCNKLAEATNIFEQVKADIQAQVIFENHLLTVNISNQLGNCYLRMENSQKALDNFENSLYVLKKYPQVQVDDAIIAKICSNISILYADKGYLNDSVRMAEKCLEYKLLTYPRLHPEIMTTYLQIGTAYMRLADHTNAYYNFEAAYDISKQVHGEFDQQTAYIVTQMATAKFKLSFFTDAIKLFEQAGVIYSRLENQYPGTDEIRTNLNKIYLQLLNMYYLVGKDQEAIQIFQVIEGRGLNSSGQEELCYKLLNEAANIMRKYNLFDDCITVYKKALSSLKQVHKTNYLQQPETIMVLTNIATAEYLRQNFKESIKYYEHALSVAQRTSQFEAAKVHVALGHVLNEYGSSRQAHSHYLQAVGVLDRTEKDAEVNKLLLEAVHGQKQIESNLF